MGDFVELTPDSCVELQVMMPVQIGPDGGVRIQIFASTDIYQDSALAANEHDGLAFQPVPHLGEGMPEIFVVQFSEKMHGGIFEF